MLRRNVILIYLLLLSPATKVHAMLKGPLCYIAGVAAATGGTTAAMAIKEWATQDYPQKWTLTLKLRKAMLEDSRMNKEYIEKTKHQLRELANVTNNADTFVDNMPVIVAHSVGILSTVSSSGMLLPFATGIGICVASTVAFTANPRAAQETPLMREATAFMQEAAEYIAIQGELYRRTLRTPHEVDKNS